MDEFDKRLNDAFIIDYEVRPENTQAIGGLTDAQPEGVPGAGEGPGPLSMESATKFGQDLLRGAKGAVTGTIGGTGDLEMVGLGVAEILRRGGDESMLQAFTRGVQQKTILPTTDSVNAWLNENVPLPDFLKGEATSPQKMGELISLGGVVTKGAQAAVKGGKALATETGKQIDRAMMEGTGPLSAVVPSAVKPLNVIEPGKFLPEQEVAQAVDIVKADPNLNVYAPQAERAPSVALRLAKPEIVGTGSKGALTVSDVGLVLEKSQLALNNGKPLDPAKPQDLVKMVDSASAEAEYQLSQPISGATWYEDDVTDAFTLGAKIVPELATDEPLRVLTTAFAASTSYNKRAGENWSVAMRITEGLMKDGKVYSRNPENGKLWGGTTGPIMEQQLKLHEYMIKRMGLEGYAEWLLTPHPVKEIAQMKADSGLYKTANIPGKATDMKMGSFLLGEKGGAFFLNLNGIKETTADKWFTRTYNRHTGTLTSGPVSEQGLVDAPRNESERSLMKSWNRAVASNVKLDEQANQAVLWYYEQSLYFNLGIKSARSESFSDGAKNLLNARGIEFTDAEIAGARGSRNEVKAATKQASAAGAGNPVGVGQAAPDDAVAAPAAARAKPAVKKTRSATGKGIK